MSDLLSVADRAVKKGLDLGADEVEVYLLSGEGTEVALENNDIHIGRTDVKSGAGVRVFKNKSLGFASTNSIDQGDISGAIERALQLANHAPPEPWNELPERVPLKTVKGLYDTDCESFGTEDALELAKDMLHCVKETDDRITVESGVFSAQKGDEAIASSRDVQAGERASAFMFYIMGMALDGDEVSNLDYSLRFTHQVRKIDVIAAANEFSERVISSLGAKTVKSFEGPVILGPNAGRQLLGTVLSHAVNSDNVQKGMSKFSEKLGETVASSQLSVVDNGLLEDGFATSSFDREGLPHSRISLIKEGQLESFIYNTKTGIKDEVGSTGNAAGDEKQSPGVATTNVVFEGGDMDSDEMVAETKHGLVVRRLSGYPDPLNGDFSAVVKGGFLIENGQIVQPVTDTMISGNVFDLVGSIEAISRERERVLNFVIPHIKVGGVAVTGK